jgi:hypothetical protein
VIPKFASSQIGQSRGRKAFGADLGARLSGILYANGVASPSPGSRGLRSAPWGRVQPIPATPTRVGSFTGRTNLAPCPRSNAFSVEEFWRPQSWGSARSKGRNGRTPGSVIQRRWREEALAARRENASWPCRSLPECGSQLNTLIILRADCGEGWGGGHASAPRLRKKTTSHIALQGLYTRKLNRPASRPALCDLCAFCGQTLEAHSRSSAPHHSRTHRCNPRAWPRRRSLVVRSVIGIPRRDPVLPGEAL